MEERNRFQEFIEGLPQLNNFEGDPDVEAVDEALAKWILKYYPGNFNFDYNRRNLMIAMFKKNAEMVDIIMTSDFKPYIDALLDMTWRKIWQEEKTRARKSRKNVDNYDFLMKLMRTVFVLGYCLKSLEKKKKPPK